MNFVNQFTFAENTIKHRCPVFLTRGVQTWKRTALARSGSLGINIGLADIVVDSPSHRGDDGRLLLCRGLTSLILLVGSRLQLTTGLLSGTRGSAAAEAMNGLSTGIDTAGVTLALKFDSSCVTASTPPSSTCNITQISSAYDNQWQRHVHCSTHWTDTHYVLVTACIISNIWIFQHWWTKTNYSFKCTI